MRPGSVILVALAACVPVPPEPPPEIGPGIGTTHVVFMCLPKPVSAVGPVSPAAQRLLAAVNELAIAHGDRALIAHAFYTLTDALETVTPGAANEILRVRRCAEALDAARPPPPRAQAEIVRFGLTEAARALDDLTDLRVAVGYRETVVALREAAQLVDPEQPIYEQWGRVRAAFRESVRAIYIASGQVVPPMVGETATAQR